MGIENLVPIVAVGLLLSYALSVDKIVKHLDKPFFLTLMRIFSSLILVAFLFFSCEALLKTYRFAEKLLQTQELKISELLWLMPGWFIIAATIFFAKSLWYFVRYDNARILSDWYVKKHLDLNKQEDFEQSYCCLQKASQIKPDSVHIWCLLASFSQLFLHSSKQADQYIARASKTLNSKSSENPKEAAILEFYSGRMSHYRGDYQTALEHMKKAYEMDPTRYRKKTYEEALEMSVEER